VAREVRVESALLKIIDSILLVHVQPDQVLNDCHLLFIRRRKYVCVHPFAEPAHEVLLGEDLGSPRAKAAAECIVAAAGQARPTLVFNFFIWNKLGSYLFLIH